MIRNQIIIALLLISFSTQESYKLDCTHYSQDECCQNYNCWWDQSNNCENKVDCEKLPYDQCSCNKDCVAKEGTPGHCDPISIGCECFDKKHCLYNKLCNWNAKQVCVPDDPQPCLPDCCKFDDKECRENCEFCQSSFTCTDKKGYCENLTEKQCKTNKGCSVVPTYTCVDNKKVCEYYNDDECKKNSKYCDQVVVKNGYCINKFDCTDFNCEECKKHDGACKSYVKTPFTCKNKKDQCGDHTCEKGCESVKGCNWNSQTHTCSSCTNCELFDEDACQDNCDICDYTPGETGCKNNVDCSLYSKSECNPKYCTAIPPVYKCKAKDYDCEHLSPEKCKDNKYCSLVPGKSKCVQQSSLGCSALSAQQCQLNSKKCDYDTNCENKKIKPCDQLNPKECEYSSYCHLEDQGGCSDKHFQCPQEECECLQHKYCNWTEGTECSCNNKFDCSTLCGEECEENPLCCHGDGQCKNKTKK